MKSIVQRNNVNSLLEIFAAEIFGATCLMYFGCMGLFGSASQVVPLPPLQGGLVFGFVVASIIVAIGHISKAHLNPAVTLCSYLLGMITPLAAVVYLLAECIGCILGFWLLKVTTPQALFDAYNSTNCGFCSTVLHETVSIPQGFLMEFMSTAFLIYIVCSVWDSRNAHISDSVPIKFGLLIAAISIAVGPFTGASMNPARSLAPALINNVWKDHWLYWAGPLIGSLTATLFYKYAFLKTESTTEDDPTVNLKCQSTPSSGKQTQEKSQNLV